MGQPTCDPGGLLRAARLRATKSRIAVLETLAKHPRPLSIKEIAKRLPSSSNIDIVTLYRMMGDFVGAGIASKIDLGRAHATFELVGENDHHHIVCTECHRVEDFEDSEHLTLAKRALKHARNFSHLTGHSFELYGRCNTCITATS